MMQSVAQPMVHNSVQNVLESLMDPVVPSFAQLMVPEILSVEMELEMDPEVKELAQPVVQTLKQTLITISLHQMFINKFLMSFRSLNPKNVSFIRLKLKVTFCLSNSTCTTKAAIMRQGTSEHFKS
jgi:hypothetical protein